ncbi:hypothetical protein NKR23_g4469 [Pleurostoma richardsiae]|uniref:DUF1772-domain-containing protein n=1 Tax=Pleurostoma richardsiae TaxID=41990 RepID=A0AA38S412_9PEZI|nr:hypothetical protein NKR23_g4469 [Pleurostoma richardsiae]
MPLSPEALTLTLSGFMSGYYFSGAYVFMPAVLKAPSPLVGLQWKQAWDVGRYVGKIVVTGTAASFAYLAYEEPVKAGSTRFQLLSLASVIVATIVPFTVFSSYPFNEAINAQIGKRDPGNERTAEKGDLKKLVVDWGRLDFYRTLLAFTGTLVGVSAFLI